jgi:ARG/rhodanese/phosphatase superfamily protein
MRWSQALAAIVVGCAAAACARTEVGPATEGPAAGPFGAGAPAAGPSAAVARLDEHRGLAAPVVVSNLTVWPVVTDKPLELGEFLTLDEATKRGVAKVTELGAASGDGPPPGPQVAYGNAGQPAGQTAANGTAGVQTAEGGLEFSVGDDVNALAIENKGELPILVCAGTIVSGGNQDRQVGEDVVIAARSKRRIEVFCVEQGRWTPNRQGVETEATFVAGNVVTTKAVRTSAQYMKSQSAVWTEVENHRSADFDIARAAEAGGRTTYMRNFENASKETSEAREKMLAAVRAHFAATRDGGSHVVGFAYAVNGTPVSVRMFAAPRVFEGQFEPFLRAMVLDAEAARDAGPGPAAKAADVVAMMEKIRSDAASAENRPGYRLTLRKGAGGWNSNCYLAPEAPAAAATPGQTVPLTEDWTAK